MGHLRKGEARTDPAVTGRVPAPRGGKTSRRQPPTVTLQRMTQATALQSRETKKPCTRGRLAVVMSDVLGVRYPSEAPHHRSAAELEAFGAPAAPCFGRGKLLGVF